MHAILALLWREYRELRWNVLAASGILIAWPLLSLCRGAWFPAGDQVQGLLLVSPILLGVFFGMRAAAGERDGHTAAFANALPVQPAVLGGVRLAATAAAVLIPLLCLGSLALALPAAPGLYGFADRKPLTAQALIWLSAAAGLHMALLVATCGAGARSEVRAAGRAFTIGGGLLCLSSLLLVGGVDALSDFGIFNRESFGVFLANLATPLFSLNPLRQQSAGLIVLVLAVLGAAFVWRYRCAVGPLAGSHGRPARAWLPATLRSGSVALALKALREQWLPLAAAGLAAIVAAGALKFNLWSVPRFLPGGTLVASPIMLFGAVAALSLGIASFAADLDPRINTFWRSRPISPARWFWTTYAAAVAPLAVVLLLGGAAMSAMNDGIKDVLSWVGMAGVSCLGLFTAGMLAICLVRRPLVAGILALGLIVAVTAAIDWFIADVPWDGTPHVAQSMTHTAVFAGGILMASLAGTVAAWWVAIRDIAIHR